MVEEFFDRLSRIRFDVYISTLGLLLFFFGGYIYFDYYLNQNPRDILTGFFVVGCFFLGYFIAIVGLIEFGIDYTHQKELLELEYERRRIRLTLSLKRIKKKHKLKDEPERWE